MCTAEFVQNVAYELWTLFIPHGMPHSTFYIYDSLKWVPGLFPEGKLFEIHPSPSYRVEVLWRELQLCSHFVLLFILTTSQLTRCSVTVAFWDVQCDQHSYYQHLPHAVSSLINITRHRRHRSVLSERQLTRPHQLHDVSPLKAASDPFLRDMTSRQHIIGSRRFGRV